MRGIDSMSDAPSVNVRGRYGSSSIFGCGYIGIFASGRGGIVMPSEYGVHEGIMDILPILFAASGAVLIGTGVYKILTRPRSTWRYMRGEMTSRTGPVTITRIDGHIESQVPSFENSPKPWGTAREVRGWKGRWKERKLAGGDTYYDSGGKTIRLKQKRGLFRNRTAIFTVKNYLNPARWWQFERLSEDSPDGERTPLISERK